MRLHLQRGRASLLRLTRRRGLGQSNKEKWTRNSQKCRLKFWNKMEVGLQIGFGGLIAIVRPSQL
jgi:hypothetical protein